MAVEKAIVFDDLQKGDDDERREGFFRGGRSRRGGLKGGKRSGSRGRRSGRMGSVRGARSRAKSRARSAARSRSRMSQRTATKSQAASRAKAKAKAAASARDKAKVNTNLGTKAQRMNKLGTKYSGKLAGAMRRANAPKAKSISSLDKKKIRNPSMFSPQDVAAALGRKSIADANAGKFKSRNEAYKANQAAIDAQKARFSGYSPSKGSDTSAIGGINAKNLGLGVQAAFNRAQNRNETTGMSLADSLRFNTRDLNLGDVAKLAGFVANPVGSVVTAALTGGEGILGTLKNAGQTALAGFTGQGTPSSGSILGNLGLGNLMDKFKNIDIGPAAPTPPDRGGRRDERMMAQMPPVLPMPTIRPTVMPRDPNQIKKAVTPVGTAVTDQAMNEYLRLAGLA